MGLAGGGPEGSVRGLSGRRQEKSKQENNQSMPPHMRLISINVGAIRMIEFEGRTFRTGIFKSPVSGPVSVGRTKLEGDGQADLNSHGGVDKAVYLYPVEHYPFWRNALKEKIAEPGSFGENLTTEGLLEDAVCIGDTFEVGTTVVQVTQPRTPCYKLAARFNRPDLPDRFLQTTKSGFYLRVLKPGQVTADDRFSLCDQDSHPVSVSHVANIYHSGLNDRQAIKDILENRSLSAEWRDAFEKRLGKSA